MDGIRFSFSCIENLKINFNKTHSLWTMREISIHIMNSMNGAQRIVVNAIGCFEVTRIRWRNESCDNDHYNVFRSSEQWEIQWYLWKLSHFTGARRLYTVSFSKFIRSYNEREIDTNSCMKHVSQRSNRACIFSIISRCIDRCMWLCNYFPWPLLCFVFNVRDGH